MFTVGLTGGIGSGKSTVAKMFAELGITVIDADKIARDVAEPHTAAYQAIISHFGHAILNKDQTLNRSRLREIIFANSTERQWLENLLHPLILHKLFMQAKQATSPYCVLEIPLLFETKLEDAIDRILVIDIPEHLQLQRLRARDKLSDDKIQAAFNTQISREIRLSKAHDVIDNSDTLDNLQAQIQTLHKKYLTMAAQQK